MKHTVKILALLLSAVLFFTACGSCSPDNDTDSTVETTDKSGNTETESYVTQAIESGESETESSETTTSESGESETESAVTTTSESDESETKTEMIAPEGENGELIALNNSLANGVQAYFADGDRNSFVLANKNMTMSYSRRAGNSQLVSYIKNAQGKSYIENTMDVYVKMADGSVHYASNSAKNASVNIYRLGYYYYEGLFEFQNFIPASFDVENERSINFKKVEGLKDVSSEVIEEGIRITVTDDNDPHFAYNVNVNTSQKNVLVFTARATGNNKTVSVYFNVNETGDFDESRKLSFALNNDGEYHTYQLLLNQNVNYEGVLKQLRFDLNGDAGDVLEISNIALGSTDIGDVPTALSISRHFHVYSNKMHHEVQFAATKETDGIAELGMITKIDADTVAEFIVKDAGGEHNTLDGVDWGSVQCVGFDIKDVGVFGYILPDIPEAGSIVVTYVDGYYVVEQSIVPENNTMIPSEKKTNNANDLHLGQRVYTDENHSFDGLLRETYIERNPISEALVRVRDSSDGGAYLGYDALRGIYVFNIETATGFYAPYNTPNKQYKVNFTVRGEKDLDRDIYVMTSGKNGFLECAALLDENLMMLPVPIEVIKNFSEPNGERNLYNLDDPTFSEAIFCLSLKADTRYTYTVLNLYQNWGKYPLKQLSGIPYTAPFYHLSTGVTETNCILPYYTGGDMSQKGYKNNTLTDFRSMSAPFWKEQPQHNSCGAHSWLEYTDSDGVFSATESKKSTITSYGPTYAEVQMDYLSDDGKIKVTYTHMEMPQTDENRTYYTMEYTVLEDVTINDFMRNFQFYDVTDNDPTGVYKRVGYLNDKNESVVVAAATSGEAIYRLGDKCPYFSFFDMPDWDRNNTAAQGYSNVAFLVYESEFIIGGEKSDAGFVIINENDHVRISLDLGNVTLKKGDSFTINAILLPWGSQEMDGKYDEIQDANVRAVRENTLLNPLKATSDTDEILESVYLPKIKSTDGKTATFTLSGGENNVTVRVYGFKKLTAPKVEILDEGTGQFVEYVISSKDSKDGVGYYHYYDGYSVNYDGDGTYSYSFVTTMTDGKAKTFRISADEDFKGWPTEIDPADQVREDLLKVYIDPVELNIKAQEAAQSFGGITLSDDLSYVTFKASGIEGSKEACVLAYQADEAVESGKYFVVKYRANAANSEKLEYIEVFISTVNGGPTDGDYFGFNIVEDGEWHVAVIDLERLSPKTFKPDENGAYNTKYFRFDVFNKRLPEDVTIDIAYVGMDSDLSEICALNAEEFEFIDLYKSGSSKNKLNTTTLETDEKKYVDPSSGYTESKAAFGALLDTVNGQTLSSCFSSSKKGMTMLEGYNATAEMQFSLAGWCGVDGGVAKYVWSADGGKTWNEFTGEVKNCSKAIVEAAQERCGVTFADFDASKTNGAFQGSGLCADLSAFAGQNIDLIVGAIPLSNESSIVLMYHFSGVSVPEEDKLNIYIDAVELNGAAQQGAESFGEIKLSDDSSYVTFKASGLEGSKEASILAYSQAGVVESGKYFVIKYRVSAENSTKLDFLEVFVSTVNSGPTDTDLFGFNIVEDGEWHVAVLDLERCGAATFKSDDNGAYNAKYFRLDVFNVRLPEDVTIDVAYVGMDSDLRAICDVNSDFEYLDLYKTGSAKNKLYTATAESDEVIYVHPDSGYSLSKVAFGALVDSVNGVSVKNCYSSSNKNVKVLDGYAANAERKFSVAGWCGVDGGVAKYVWSADGGKTWNEFTGDVGKASKGIVEAAQERCGVTFADLELSKTNGAFQGAGLCADLSAYAGQTVGLTFGAIPLSNENSIVLLYHFANVVVQE